MSSIVARPVKCFLARLSRFNKIVTRNYAQVNKQTDKKDNKKYSHTVLLPETKFPMRLNGVKRVEMDNYLMEKCGFSELYSWQRENLSPPDFILHDGPPYANGEPHMGHAVNKILKDITLRSRVIRGQRVHYIPGWDCHGLPIELKVLSTFKKQKENLSPVELRELARQYSRKELENQKAAFASWGVLADWKDTGCYFTNEISYMQNELKQFIKLYNKNLIFRDFKPVYWSPSSGTALAESELEYNDKHKSKCATIRLKVTKLPESLQKLQTANKNIYALTWTTTPWTLVANQALSYSPDLLYTISKDEDGNLYIIAKNLLPEVSSKIGKTLTSILEVNGDDLRGSEYSHPISGESLPFLSSNHVTDKVGTGLVHTAPAHGNEDFLVCLSNNIPVKSLVDSEGRYTQEAGPQFSGLEVLREGTPAVLSHLKDNVLHTEEIVHSYPYDWRTKKPVITRASHQWFINTEKLKQPSLQALTSIQIFPKSKQTVFMNNLTQQIAKRPFWCISRQRSWGTPIPVFYNKKTKEIVTNDRIIERICKKLDKDGADCWWNLSVRQLLGRKIVEEFNLIPEDLEKGEDILDIWFDSGVSWSAVLPDVADVYLEGMDQFNGWFYSSLMTSMAIQGKAPFKSIFVHGFTVDKNGQKMSKSLGNVISPKDVVSGKKDASSALGTDVLRFWVASHGVQHTHIPVVDNVLKNSAESLQKIRSVLRFLLGALHQHETVGNDAKAEYLMVDKYMLHKLYHYNKEIQRFYDDFDYHHAAKALVNFVANDVSAFYCPLVKDRLYCEEAGSPVRIAAVDVVDDILTVVTRSMAPIVPHLAEEVWLYHPENLASVPLYHSAPCQPPDEWDSKDVEDVVNSAIAVKSLFNRTFEGNSAEVKVNVRAGGEVYQHLLKLQGRNGGTSTTSELSNILQVSSVTLIEVPSSTTTQIDVEPIEYALCKRCRKYPETTVDEPCVRCKRVLNGNTAF